MMSIFQNSASLPPSTPVDRRELAWLLGCLLLALIVRLGVVAALDITPVSDAAGYRAIAMNIVAGRGVTDGANQAFLSAGYSMLLLAPVFWLSDGSLLAAQAANALLGVLTTWLCWAIAREAGAGARARLLAALFFALYLPSWVYAEYLAKENLMTPLMLALLWSGLRFWRTPSPRAGWVAATVGGLACGLIAMVGNAGLALVPVLVAGLVLGRGTATLRSAQFALVVLLAVLVALPWAIRNKQVVGSAVMNTNGGFNLYLGNNPAATGMFVSIADTPGAQRWYAAKREGEVFAATVMRNEALDWIRSHPDKFVRLALHKAVLFWTPPVHDGEGTASRAEEMARVIWLGQYLVLCALAGASLFLLRSPPQTVAAPPAVALLWIALLGYTAVHMLFYVIFRYREPMMPVLAVLAAMTLDGLLRKVRARRPHVSRVT